MILSIETDGKVRCLYDESLDLTSLGELHIQRASHVEPNDKGEWLADLAPVLGPILGPFAVRSEALSAEHDWLIAHWLNQ